MTFDQYQEAFKTSPTPQSAGQYLAAVINCQDEIGYNGFHDAIDEIVAFLVGFEEPDPPKDW